MSQVEESAENIKHEVQSLLKQDTEIRQSLEKYRDLLDDLDDLDTHPYYHLFAAWEHRRMEKKIRKSLWLIFRHLYGGEEGADGVPKASLETLEEDELIAGAISQCAQQKDSNRVSIPEVEEWLIRQNALQWGFYELQDLAFASALLERPMPPFEARASRNQEERWMQVFAEYKRLDHPLKNRLETLRTEAEEGRMFTPQLLKVMVRDALQSHLSQLVASNFSRFKTYRRAFIQKAEANHESFLNDYDDLVSEYAECIVAHEVASGISIAPTEERKGAFKDALRATDLGAEWVLDGDARLDNFRKQMRSERRRLLVKLYAWIQVHEAIERSGNPEKAKQPARITEEKGTDGQLFDLQYVHDLLLAYPNLRDAETEEDWKDKFFELDLNFEGYKRKIERLAHSCFETERKPEWPDRYRNYDDSFATLIQDLWDDSWVDHI